VPAIDLASPPDNLTELVEIGPEESFVIHPGEFVLGRTEEVVEMPDDIVSRIEGKALALHTEIPTPGGWRTMGELEAGDEVFSEWGKPIPVVGVTDVLLDRPCYEVGFSDGTTVVADGAHIWRTSTRADRRYGLNRLVTTEEIARSLTIGKAKIEYNHHVDLTGPVWYPQKELPIDPYVLGVWIGDGTSSNANVTSADAFILDQLQAAGYPVHKAAGKYAWHVGGAPRRRDAATGRYTANASLHSTLRATGLLNNKHIPEEYMEAGRFQRQALLEGLMDTDGYCDKWGRCELTTMKKDLAEQYRELVASLGFKPVIAAKVAWLNGKNCGMKYDVTFTPHWPVFRLPRKLARQRVLGDGHFKISRGIVSVRPVESVPVRCIEVGTPSGMYLATRSFIPTHNSSLGRLGLIVHATAGFVDPGFSGSLTLEITNLTRVPIILWPGKPIAQLSFMTLDAPAERPYGHPDLGSHYHGQVDATESRYEGGPAKP
jgi:deoxycytidine triphosphate deaminase